VALEEAAAAPFPQVHRKSFNKATNGGSPAPQSRLQVASPCCSQRARSASRQSGHNICLKFTASLAQTLSLKPLLKDLPNPSPFLIPSPCWPQPASGTGL